MLTRHRFLASLLFLAATTAGAGQAHAQTTFFETGFEASEGYSTTISGPITIYRSNNTESTTFDRAPGALVGQPSTNPRTFSFYNFFADPSLSFADSERQSVNSSTVVNSAAATGTQSLRIDGSIAGNQGLVYTTDLSLNAASNGVANFSADIRIDNPSATNFGQWGMELLGNNASGGLTTFAAFGTSAGYVLATNGPGTSVYAAIDPNTFQPLSVTPGSFNNYQMRLNYSDRTIQGLFNNSLVAFLPIDPATFTPLGQPVASLALTSQFGNRIDNIVFGNERPNTTETSYFDNFRITGTNVTVVPESGTLALVLPVVGCVSMLVVRCRFRTKPA